MVREPAHTLEHCLLERRPLSRHLGPRTEAQRQLTVQQVAQTPYQHRLVARERRGCHVPRGPGSRQLQVRHMLQGSQELLGPRRTELGVLDRRQPSGEAKRHLPVDHEACTLSQLANDLGTQNSHLDPRAPAARYLVVEHVACTTLQRSALVGTFLPRRVPRVPAEREIPVDRVAEGFRHRVVARRNRCAPFLEAKRQLVDDQLA